jgi:solute carrier family 25 citrate transporter 1
MGSYNALKELSQRYEINQNIVTTFLMGAIAGTITVYTTQPFDSIKTRSQGLAGMGVGTALRSIIQDHGIKGLWNGSSMRLGRLILSGGIVFTVYEKTQGVLQFLFT